VAEKIKVMIIDDSALIRNIVTRMLSANPAIEVVGTALNGRFGLSKLDRLRPDIIILDLEMPEMNGIEFLKERKRLGISIPVIILSSIARKGAQITLEALSLGASDFILKPSEQGSDIEVTRDKLIEMVLGLAAPDSYKEDKIKLPVHKIPDILKEIPQEKAVSGEPAAIKNISNINIVVIGISTGGPNALREMLPLFPDDFPVPIVIVQHMPPGFTLEFANSLNKICSLEVKEAGDNDIVAKGRILIAPGGKHVRFEKRALATVIRIDDSEPVNGHKPSCDVLFESAAAVYGNSTLGCIMTGMGKDGAVKLGNILRVGGVTIGQDRATSIVYGMPNVAFSMGHVQIVRPLQRLAGTIINIVVNKMID
jgi:two-component system, chemotaxis family, protein-glutamate methylesterase/glutaminase